MVTGVDGDHAFFFAAPEFARQQRVGLNFDVVSGCYLVGRRMVHIGLNMLDQSAGPPYIQRLESVTNSKNRLAHVVCVLQKEFVSSIAQWIGLSIFRMLFFAVFLRINICLAAWQENGRA